MDGTPPSDLSCKWANRSVHSHGCSSQVQWQSLDLHWPDEAQWECVAGTPHSSICEKTLAQLGVAKIFSKLDAISGLCQIKLSKESVLLTTFITPLGCYCFKIKSHLVLLPIQTSWRPFRICRNRSLSLKSRVLTQVAWSTSWPSFLHTWPTKLSPCGVALKEKPVVLGGPQQRLSGVAIPRSINFGLHNDVIIKWRAECYVSINQSFIIPITRGLLAFLSVVASRDDT